MRTVIRTIADWVNTRYTPKGKLLLISLAFSSLLSLDPYNNNSYYIACLCFIFLAIAHVGAYFQDIPVKLKRENLRPFNCDEEGHYYITISNLGEETLEDLKILDEYKLVHPDDMLAEVAVNALIGCNRLARSNGGGAGRGEIDHVIIHEFWST